MSRQKFDFAVFGNSPFAALLAVALAGGGSRKVCLAGPAWSPLQLVRGIDLSVGPFTRPETWEMLTSHRREAEASISKVSPNALGRTDVAMLASSSGGRAALGHIRLMADAFGLPVEIVAGSTGIGDFVFRDVARLDRRKFLADFEIRHTESGIKRFGSLPDSLDIQRDGASFRLGETEIDADRIVLADDENWELLSRDSPVRSLAERRDTHVLMTGSGTQLCWPVVLGIDQGAYAQTQTGGHVETAFAGGRKSSMNWLGRVLAKQSETQIIGEADFTVTVSKDGAPIVQSEPNGIVWSLAGFSPTGMFLVPALERFLTNSATKPVSAYFESLSCKHELRPSEFVGQAGAVA